MTMRLYLVRHGLSTNNAGITPPDLPDPDLADAGREQARLAGEALSNDGVAAEAVYTSPLRRALQTAEILRRFVGGALHAVPDLCEVGGTGGAPGMSREELLRGWPECVAAPGITSAGWAGTEQCCSDREVVHRRALRALDAIYRDHLAAGSVVVAITHGSFNAALLRAALGIDAGAPASFTLWNCAISLLEIEPGAPDGPRIARINVRYHNSSEHLPRSLRT